MSSCQALTFTAGDRALCESASPPHKRGQGVQGQVGARGDPGISVGGRSLRADPVRCPAVRGRGREHGGGRGGG